MLPDVAAYTFIAVLSYLIGSLPFSYWLIRRTKGFNLTEVGSGNVGVINAYMVGGVATVAFTIAGEILKAASVIGLALWLGDGSLYAKIWALSAAVLGTNFSIFLKGKGGKGATLFMWGQAFIVLWVPVALALVSLICFVGSRYWLPLKSLWILSMPPVFYLATQDLIYAAFGIVAALFFYVRTNKANDDYQVHGLLQSESDKSFIEALDKAEDSPSLGNKARNLKFLLDKGELIPKTFVCRIELYELYRHTPQKAMRQLRSELGTLLTNERRYAVRSSANVEDHAHHSFAGQFETYLDVSGIDELAESIKDVWDSARSQRVHAYGAKTDVGVHDIKMAVVIQEMVPPKVSGVAFSHNPLNGLHETVIEAVGGLGDQLVQGGVTPGRWIRKWGSWIEKPDLPVLTEELAAQVAKTTERLSKTVDAPVDIEWVYDGSQVYCVQLREITGLDDINVYSNRLSKEFLPGAIKPLIWSINVPLVNSAWVRLLTEVIGPNDIDPNTLAKSFFYRAYFNMGDFGRILERLGFPPDGIELLSGLGTEGPDKPTFRPTLKTLPLVPKMIRCTIDKLRFRRPLDTFISETRREFEIVAATDYSAQRDSEILASFDRLYRTTENAAYFYIVTLLLSWAYHAGLGRQLKSYDVALENLEDYVRPTIGSKDDPNPHIATLHSGLVALPAQVQRELESQGLAALDRATDPASQVFNDDLQSFIRDFGHFSDSGNDFSAPPWRETPQLILEMVRGYESTAKAANRTTLKSLKIGAPKRALVTWLLKKSIDFKLYRDEVSSLYTVGYGLFRDLFLEVGRRLVEQQKLSAEDDIFYLNLDELRQVLSESRPPDVMFMVQSRQREMSKYCDIDSFLPSVIYGDSAPVLKEGLGDVLEGLPTSGGVYSGPVKVVKGLGDFDKIEDGDVLVVPYSDVGWTPLFAKAGAIVAESGGMLSHSSIVAREYNIPAVVSVAGACQLNDFAIVTVDGQQGLIRIEEDEKAYASL